MLTIQDYVYNILDIKELVQEKRNSIADALELCLPCYKSYAYNILDIDGLVPERHNSIANALELRLSCTIPWYVVYSKD